MSAHRPFAGTNGNPHIFGKKAPKYFLLQGRFPLYPDEAAADAKYARFIFRHELWFYQQKRAVKTVALRADAVYIGAAACWHWGAISAGAATRETVTGVLQRNALIL